MFSLWGIPSVHHEDLTASCRGILTTFGAFQEYYQTQLLPEQSPSAISWIGSIQATLIPMIGIVSGPLVDAGYIRSLIAIGSFLTVFGMMMTSLATEYYQVCFRVSCSVIILLVI